ncbi:hypothetical protein N473_01410 [Pseudoalteromonas luteoviolacea CPMOR-1]|uniref:Uncharacterized protein n=1 Tax=Pseudoalteromonas luteoviolacea CPMOR-1 TaxID=1365248 RepID=A0A161YST2_9GAMM|nr:hypothetical protein [Pseudoalteromonas luteoviolacea]KZN65260.1 hypothetical protein N473_01410 [Pseudoalteromonas luteoviolacea CPMOR-1]
MKQNLHWRYYLSLESDVCALSRYIHFAPDNFKTYSIELAKLYLAICAEVEVVLKEICDIHPNKKGKNANINIYRQWIVENQQGLIAEEVLSFEFELKYVPWKAFEEGRSPSWWSDYNNVKHERRENFNKANLGNVLESLAGLYITNLYLEIVLSERSGYSHLPKDINDVYSQLPHSHKLFQPFCLAASLENYYVC